MTALHIRLIRKLEAGKGGMTLERADLDLMAELGVIDAIVLDGIKRYTQCLKPNAPSRSMSEVSIRSTGEPTERTLRSSGTTPQQDANAALARVQALFPKASKPSTASISDSKRVQRAGAHTTSELEV